MANSISENLASEEDCFYFESDHLALKGNKDYCDVLKTLCILTAQQKRALQDINKVVEIRKRALENPMDTLEQIKSGSELGLPPMYELPKIPSINFDKYNVKVPSEELKAIYAESPSQVLEKDSITAEPNNFSNGAWTPEEQKRLEELLIVFPPEPIEMRRFQKIARALGNRTVQQVCSRVQKYFLKLYKAGLPIPGRIPKSSEKYKKSMIHKHQRYNHYLWKPTTFFPDLIVPVTMNELENTPGPDTSSLLPTSDLQSKSSNYLIPSGSESTSTQAAKSEPEHQLNLLKRIKIEKMKETSGNHNLFQHQGYRCDFCDTEPIVGTRWHCATCNDSVDFCMDCVVSQMYSNDCHPLHHSLVIFYNDTESSVSDANGLDTCDIR